MQPQNSAGLCECGCGQKTALAPQTDTQRGWIRGEPVRFIRGHRSRLGHAPPTPETREKISAAAIERLADPAKRQEMSALRMGVPRPPEVTAKMRASLTGRSLSPEHRARLSEAQKARGVTPAMRAAHDEFRGQGHPDWQGDEADYRVKHQWLNKYHPKTGICTACGEKAARTEWAYLHHPKPHTRNIADYQEMCIRCHRRMDVDDRIERLARELIASGRIK